MSWTEERVQRLVWLWCEEKKSASQIASELGQISRNAVIGKIHRLGIAGRYGQEKITNTQHKPSHSSQHKTTSKSCLPKTKEKPVIKSNSDSIFLGPTKEKNTQEQNQALPKFAQESSNSIVLPSVAEEEKEGKIASILDLHDHICRWPVGDPGKTNFRFCGCPAVPNAPYCSYHMGLAYHYVKKGRTTGSSVHGIKKTKGLV